MPRDILPSVADHGRIKTWFLGLTDARLSAYMLLLAGLIAALLFLLDRTLFSH